MMEEYRQGNINVCPTFLGVSSRQFPVFYGKSLQPFLLNKKNLALCVHHKPCHTCMNMQGERREQCTVETLNKGHFGANSFVLCREVVPVSEVK